MPVKKVKNGDIRFRAQRNGPKLRMENPRANLRSVGTGSPRLDIKKL